MPTQRPSMVSPPSIRTTAWSCGLREEAQVLARTIRANEPMAYHVQDCRGLGWLASSRRGTSRKVTAGGGCTGVGSVTQRRLLNEDGPGGSAYGALRAHVTGGCTPWGTPSSFS